MATPAPCTRWSKGGVLRALGCKPHRRETFFLADGTAIERDIGDAYFEHGWIGGAAPIIVGEEGDQNLLGATTLEALELVLEPFKRELRPMATQLMGGAQFR